jgi:hypothetical protein
MKIVFGLLLAGSLLSGVVLANDDVNALVGLEAGIGSMDAGGTGHTLYTGGLKIGAKNDDYGVFLSARTLQINNFKNANTLGGELQYFIPIGSRFNAFLEANVGKIGMKTDTTANQRDISTYYYGGGLGMNVALTKSIDFEVGGRLMYINYDHVLNNVTYNVDSLVQGYSSIIFKFPTK